MKTAIIVSDSDAARSLTNKMLDSGLVDNVVEVSPDEMFVLTGDESLGMTMFNDQEDVPARTSLALHLCNLELVELLARIEAQTRDQTTKRFAGERFKIMRRHAVQLQREYREEAAPSERQAEAG